MSDLPIAPTVPSPTSSEPDHVCVSRGALQAVLNMLRRDAAEGRLVRGEMADDLERSRMPLPPGMSEFLADLDRSRAKYPGNARMFDGLLGEVDELRRAYTGDGDRRAEAFDVAVCAFRIAVEGDSGGNAGLSPTPARAAEQSAQIMRPQLASTAPGQPAAFEAEMRHGIYMLSRDYRRLYELLCSNPATVAVGFVDHKFRPDDSRIMRDVCGIQRVREYEISFSVRGRSYAFIYEFMRDEGPEDDLFVRTCESVNLEWVEP